VQVESVLVMELEQEWFQMVGKLRAKVMVKLRAKLMAKLIHWE
jgi:hypothetical protein